MKPVRLELRGFTAFRDETVVDFEGRRIFVITGPTGAGKSSLLDAMTWALYGQVPRVGRSVSALVSQGEREMAVLFEFTVRGRPYRVSRRYPGTTSTRLERQVEGQWVPLADRAAEVTRQVETLLGMDYATFTRAIVLPQGEFDSFLQGEKKERRDILSQLIGLGIYQEAAGIARVRAAAARTQAETIRAQLEQLQFATPEAVATLEQRTETLRGQQAALATQRAELTALRQLATADREQRAAFDLASKAAAEASAESDSARLALVSGEREQEAASAALACLEQEQVGLGYDPAAHDRLKAQVALLNQRADADAAVARAREEARLAEAAVAMAAAALAAASDGAKAATAAAREAEREQRAAAKELATLAGRASRALALVEEEAATLAASALAADAESRALDQRARDLETLAVVAREVEGDLKRATSTVERARKEAASATKAAEQAASARDRATSALDAARDALEQARAQDAAAHLRSTLKPGDTCPVCGEPITRVARAPRSKLGAAERVVEEAEAVLAAARRETEQAAASAASAAAREEEGRRALAATEARLSAVDRQAEELGVARDALAAAAREAKAGAALQAKEAAARRAVEAERRAAQQALRDALARVPEEVEAAAAKRGGAEPQELRSAIEAYRAASTAAGDAGVAVTTAAQALAQAERDAVASERDLGRAQDAVVTAERQLERLGGVEGDAAAVHAALAAVERQAARSRELVEAAQQAREALARAQAAVQAAAGQLERARQRAAERAAGRVAAEAAAGEAQAAFHEAWRQTVGQHVAPSLKALKDVMDEHEVERERVTAALAVAQQEAESTAKQVEHAARMRGEAEAQQAVADLAGAAATELRGDRFIAFLLNESMQLLAADASGRLAQFTRGRYELVADEDEFLVLDHLNGDERRSVKTLSGGETFLASLALALSLSEHLPEISGTGGAVSLDSLFLDEGFGALDAEALDLAVQGLEGLADGSRMVGVISHLDELAERLPARIRVEKGPHGSTVVA